MNAIRTDALLLDRDLSLALGSRGVPPPGPGQALVRVEWAGVCGSDLHVLATGDWVSYWPATLGHEIVGVVESCPGAELPVGTRVVVDSRVPCRCCAGCARAANLCERLAWVGEAHPGGFAGHCTLDVRALLPCPDGLEATVAVLAEPLAVATHALGKVAAAPDRILLLGYGPIGALIHAEARYRWPGVPVLVVEPMAERRCLARALGARTGAMPEGRCADLVVDAAGYPGSLGDALARCVNGGTVLVPALGHQPVGLLPAELTEHALTVIGVNGFDDELPSAVTRLAADPDGFRPIITEALLLSEAADRLPRLAGSPATGKVVIGPWQG